MGWISINCGCCGEFDTVQFELTGTPPAYRWKQWITGLFTTSAYDLPRRSDSSDNWFALSKMWDSDGVELQATTTASGWAYRDTSPDGTNYGQIVVSGTTYYRAYDYTISQVFDTAVPSDVNSPGVVTGRVCCDNSGAFYYNAAGGKTYNTAYVNSSGTVTQKWNMPGLTGGAGLDVILDSEDGEAIVQFTTANSSNDWLQKVDNTGSVTWSYPGDSNYTAFDAVEVRNSGNTYAIVTVSGTEYWEVIDSSGSMTSQVAAPISPLYSGPTSASIDSSGNWYVICNDSGIKIRKYNSSATQQWETGEPKNDGTWSSIFTNSSNYVTICGGGA